MKNTIYVEGIKRYLMSKSGVNSIVARLSAKYKMLPQQFIRKGDDEIIVIPRFGIGDACLEGPGVGLVFFHADRLVVMARLAKTVIGEGFRVAMELIDRAFPNGFVGVTDAGGHSVPKRGF